MDSPDEERLKQTIERLTQENAKLRSQLAVAEQWNPPLDLEHAFRTAKGWECVTVPLIPERPTLILISGTKPGTEQSDTAAGEVWRHLQTAAPPRGRIGPFARARMPERLLGYLREQEDRTIIVLNKDLRRGQVSRAARMLRSNARTRHPHLLELSIIPLLGLYTLHQGGSAKGLLGLSAAVAPTTAIALSAAIAPSTRLYPENQSPPARTAPTSYVTQSNKEIARPAPEQHKTPQEETEKRSTSSGTARAPDTTAIPSCPASPHPPDRPPVPSPVPSASPSSPPPPKQPGHH